MVNWLKKNEFNWSKLYCYIIFYFLAHNLPQNKKLRINTVLGKVELIKWRSNTVILDISRRFLWELRSEAKGGYLEKKI
jgi:hypothetical protein